MTSYHLWTVGCQMNVADSERLGLSLDQLGYESVGRAEDADIVVLNSCVVRQGAEDKVVGRLDSLKSYKKNNPDATIASWAAWSARARTLCENDSRMSISSCARRISRRSWSLRRNVRVYPAIPTNLCLSRLSRR